MLSHAIVLAIGILIGRNLARLRAFDRSFRDPQERQRQG
jgi:hypothetical protein